MCVDLMSNTLVVDFFVFYFLFNSISIVGNTADWNKRNLSLFKFGSSHGNVYPYAPLRFVGLSPLSKSSIHSIFTHDIVTNV